MPADTLTIALHGRITLDRFAEAVTHFRGLVDALTAEAGGEVRWIIDELEASSAIATVRADTKDDAGWQTVERVLSGYLTVGIGLQRGDLDEIASEPVQREALQLAQTMNGDVEAIRFETAAGDVTLTGAPAARPTPTVAPQPPAYGSVQGRVQTLSNRRGLRFTLYDLLNDKAVSCYLAEGQQDLMRDAWGRLAEVEGVVSRDPRSGRPLTLRRVAAVRIMPESDPEGYRRARGALPSRRDLPEQRIRANRDA